MSRIKRMMLLCAALSPLWIGCDARSDAHDDSHEHGEDHDHLHEHDHDIPEHRPRDFGDAVERIDELQAHVVEEINKGHAAHAHEAIHVMIDIARWLPEIAADSDMPASQWNNVHADAQELGRICAAIDQSLHQSSHAIDAQMLAEVPAIVGRLQRIDDNGAWRTDQRVSSE